MSKALSTNPSFTYPWAGLEKYLNQEKADFLQLLSYGSLMNKESAAITLPSESQASFVPAIGYGIRRIFNYKMPPSANSRHGKPYSEEHIAALNVESTGNPEDAVNGILINIPIRSIESFRNREVGYSLISVPTVDWTSRKTILGSVFTLECPNIDETILPHLRYLDICESGASSVSASFLDFFRQTTFLADHTPLMNWKRE